jgi:acyl-CoA synthetase (AMP-forming)/AMP-acid ligase II
VPDYIADFATTKPDDRALIEGDTVVTWAQWHERRGQVAQALESVGVAPGDAVALYEVNSVDFFILLSAIQMVGATAVQINWRLTAEEVLYVLGNSDAVAVLVNEAYLPTVDQIAFGSSVKRWVILGDAQRDWADNLDDLVAAAAGRPAIEAGRTPGGTMIYTGGTTGRPKGVRRKAVGPDTVDVEVLQALAAFAHTMRLDLPHTHLVTAALYHQGPIGYALSALTNGGTAVIMRKFDPEEALRLIERHRVTSTFMPPVVAKRVIDLPEVTRRMYDTSSLEVFVVTAGPVPQKLKEDILDAFGPVYYEAYSSTETAMCATALTPADVRERPGSCGRVVAGRSFTVRDDNGDEVPRGTRGLICCPNQRGTFEGYYKDPETSRDVFRDEWLTVGDIGYMDDDGFLYIVDRQRDMIISGGTNIYSAEIENVLHEHPAIADVAVFGVPDDEWGERVHAALQLKPGESLSLEQVQEFARRKLAGYKVPREISLHATFPRDAAGKLTKAPLRAPYWPATQPT